MLATDTNWNSPIPKHKKFQIAYLPEGISEYRFKKF